MADCVSFPGLWTLFAFLAGSCLITCFLWYKLGGSSEYVGDSTIERSEIPAVAATAGDEKDVLRADGSKIGAVPVQELGKTAGM